MNIRAILCTSAESRKVKKYFGFGVVNTIMSHFIKLLILVVIKPILTTTLTTSLGNATQRNATHLIKNKVRSTF